MKTFGIRFSNGTYQIGEEMHPSYIWEDNVKTEEQLAGTSAIYVDYDPIYDEEPDWIGIAQKYHYPYDHCYILCTEEPTQWGEDAGEIIMPEARIWKQIW